MARPKGNVIHHLDGNKLNKDINNLIMLSKSEHSKLHCEVEIKLGTRKGLFKIGSIPHNKGIKGCGGFNKGKTWKNKSYNLSEEGKLVKIKNLEKAKLNNPKYIKFMELNKNARN